MDEVDEANHNAEAMVRARSDNIIYSPKMCK